MTTSESHDCPHSWSSDGSVVAFQWLESEMKDDLLLLRLGAEPTMEVFLGTPYYERQPEI